MPWIEIVKFRTDAHDLQKLVHEFILPLTTQARAEGLAEIAVYYHAYLLTDLSIHLAWDTEGPYESALAQQLIDTLDHYGLTDHSAWIACPGQVHRKED